MVILCAHNVKRRLSTYIKKTLNTIVCMLSSIQSQCYDNIYTCITIRCIGNSKLDICEKFANLMPNNVHIKYPYNN